MKALFTRTRSLRDRPTHYCPGCGHGIAHRLIAEAVDQLGLRGRTIGVAPVGCAVIAYDYWDFDCCEAAHGRALAVATGIKRVQPERIVFTYQGDGDLAAIGTAETIHAANRGENVTVFFINNAVYGMTGGQMAPTTLLKQVTATTPRGRQPAGEGHPLRIAEILQLLPGVFSVVRVSLHAPAEIRRAQQAVREALCNQVEGKGFSLVEILSPCPTYWGVAPTHGVRWLEEQMLPAFPLGKFK